MITRSQPSLLTPQFSPKKSERLSVFIAFYFQQNNEQHEHYITLIKQACFTHNIECKTINLHTTSVDHIMKELVSVPLTMIVCLDNHYAHIALTARTKLQSSAPLICIDLQAPHTIPAPLPPKYITITSPLSLFAAQLCQPIAQMPSIQYVGIIYDENDPILYSLLPGVETWLSEQNYKVHTTTRKPTISSTDVATWAQYDLLIFLCRLAPDHYLQRLAIVCKEHQTLLYATHATAINYGAVLTFTPNMTLIVRETINILIEYVTTNNLPPSKIIDFQLMINNHELIEHPVQAAELEAFITLVQTATIVSPTTADKVEAYLRVEHIPLE